VADAPAQYVRKGTNVTLVALFALLIYLPAVDMFFGLDRTPAPTEKRKYADKPELAWQWRTFLNFPRMYEAYFNDHFGYRNWLIHNYNDFQVQRLGTVPSPDVIKGKSGWLFYSGDRTLEFCRATNPFTAAELEEWRKAIERRTEWLAERGARYLVVIVPIKHTVYREELPGWLVQVGEKTRLEQLAEYMKANSNVEILDLRRALLNAKKRVRVYHRTDTHWNDEGAFAAYREIMEKLSRWFPDARATPESGFAHQCVEGPGGDLAVMLGQQKSLKEERLFVRPKGELRARRVDPGEFYAKGPWKQETRPVVTECPNAPIGKAVVFRDSLMNKLIPFLSEHFGKVVYLWHQEFDPRVVEREKPDVVIHELGERVLMRTGFLQDSQKAGTDR
jgi:alginate O-acetyltransferase complex protein AlgJ